MQNEILMSKFEAKTHAYDSKEIYSWGMQLVPTGELKFARAGNK